MVQGIKCRLKVFLIWSSGSPFVQRSVTILCKFGRGYQEEQFCEMNLGQWFRNCFFRRFLIWSSGGPLVQWSGTIYAILKKGIMGNIHVKLNEIRTSGLGGDVV